MRSPLVTARPKIAAFGLIAAILILASACGSGGQASSAASVAAGASASEAAGASVPAGATPTAGPVGPASLDAAQDVAAGAKFDVNWTGPRGQGDYITIVAAAATKWTNEPYFNVTGATSPGSLIAPVQDGAYALWYVSGADDTILARRAIRITPFVGSLTGPGEVMAGSRFDVAWTGPDGPRDYVTIAKVGATKWTDESFFYTVNDNNPGELVAALDTGAYELWYVTGTADSIEVTSPITVTPYVVTLNAPDQIAKGAAFDITWTGPNGPQDYLTITLASSAPGAFGDYEYTVNFVGKKITLQAPATAGSYEIRYQSDRIKDVVFGSRPITVK
jgi:Ca-activated chloride channel family protein